MKAMTFVLVFAILLFAAQWTGAFIQPMNGNGTTGGQGNGQYTALPNGAVSQGVETETVYPTDTPQESIPAIPEPSTALLIALGLVGTGASRIKRRRRK